MVGVPRFVWPSLRPERFAESAAQRRGSGFRAFRASRSLFVPKCVDRIGTRDTRGMSKDSKPGDEEGCDARCNEVTGIQADTVGVTFKPVVQIVIRDWPGDRIGQQ